MPSSAAPQWKWERPLHAIRDASGARLCGLVNGTVAAAVLPLAQFGNTLTHGVLQLARLAGVAPIAMHATFMRRQTEPYKIARFREYGLWHDPPRYYGGGGLRLLTFDLRLPVTLLSPVTIAKGGLPVRHFQLMLEQVGATGSRMARANSYRC